MHNIKSGDLIVWNRESGIYSTLIKIATLSEFTHVGIAVEEDDGIYIIEALPPVVRKIKMDLRTPFMYIPMNVEFDAFDYEYLHSFIGRKYSKLQAVLSLLDIYINDDKWYCTEMAYEYYYRHKMDLNIDKHLTPTRFVDSILYQSNKSLIAVNKISN